MSGRWPVVYCNGWPARLAARRPNGVLVEGLLSDGTPKGVWSEVTIARLELRPPDAARLARMIDELSAAEFITDRPAPDQNQLDLWWMDNKQ